jgi:hypothetical protein
MYQAVHKILSDALGFKLYFLIRKWCYHDS